MSKHNHSIDEPIHTLLIEELMCHLPYGIFSIAFGLTILSFFQIITFGNADLAVVKKDASLLFHNFHFMHIIFAATGTIITFSRFSKSIIQALILGVVSPTIFCMLSDVILPYLGAKALGVTLKLHICFITEPMKVLPFLFIGVLNGLVMSRHADSKQWIYSVSSHAIHIFISSLASIFYLVSSGFLSWNKQLGGIFLFLIVAVVLPCTFSDVIIPMIVAKRGAKKNEG